MKIIFVDDDPVQLDKLRLVLRGEKNLEMAGMEISGAGYICAWPVWQWL